MRMSLIAASLALSAATAAHAAGFAEHAAIDAEVARFTGHPVGEPGGARLPVDRRLRLADCQQPLAVEWYGSSGATVLVRCPVAGGWRLFVPVDGVPGPAAAAPAEPVVERGESVAIALRGRGFTLTRQGEALEAGAVGEWIRVRPVNGNPRDRGEPLRARVLRPGTVGMEMP